MHRVVPISLITLKVSFIEIESEHSFIVVYSQIDHREQVPFTCANTFQLVFITGFH